MKAITLYQPWATLWVLGLKKDETRSWATKFRGTLAVQASTSLPARNQALMFQEPFFSALKAEPYFDMEGTLPTGVIVGTVDLRICLRILPGQVIPYPESAFGDYRAGRFRWVGENHSRWAVRPRAKGKLGIWEWEGDHG